MCNRFYLAADRPLPVIPYVFMPGAPRSLTVEPSGNPTVRQWLVGSHVYEAGSWMGCGCGFSYRDLDQRDTASQARFEARQREWYARLGRDYDTWQEKYRTMNRNGRESIAALATYVREAVRGGRTLELLHCWLGREAEPPTQRLAVTPAVFGGPRFGFGTKTVLFTVSETGEAA